MKSSICAVWTALAMVSVGCDPTPRTQPDAAVQAPRAAPSVEGAVATTGGHGFLKGQLHLHSNRSGDSETPPEDVAAWYASRGFDFIVFTDHNRVTDTADPSGMLTLPGVELTQNLQTCEPRPAPEHRCLLHVDALFVTTAPSLELLQWPEPAPAGRVALFERAIDLGREMGGLTQINHPNFHYAADVDVLVAVASRGATLIEIANMAVDSQNEGDATHPSTEALWDASLARGARLFATATDDAHHYGDAERVRARGETAYVGDRGWVMVRAARDAESIRAAVARGDFYASTGVLLSRLELSPEAIAVDVVRPASGAVIELVGEGGRVVQRSEGTALRADPRGVPGRYLRVRVTAPDGSRAWTQPLWR
jgi:hypothetical protein